MHLRHKKILSDLTEFRVLSRDDILDLHFSHVKHKVRNCNQVLNHLRQQGYVEVNTNTQPYLYFPFPSPIKIHSQKSNHFRAIVQFYKQIRQVEEPSYFKVEPKYGSPYMEPDLFMIWREKPYFVEIQRSVYTTRKMEDKLSRYQSYFASEK